MSLSHLRVLPGVIPVIWESLRVIWESPETEYLPSKKKDNLVLDFSSGSAKMVPNTATNVKIVSAEDGSGAFSTFRYHELTILQIYNFTILCHSMARANMNKSLVSEDIRVRQSIFII